MLKSKGGASSSCWGLRSSGWWRPGWQGVWCGAGGWAVSAAGGAGLGRPWPTWGTRLSEQDLETEQCRRVCGEARWARVKSRKGSWSVENGLTAALDFCHLGCSCWLMQDLFGGDRCQSLMLANLLQKHCANTARVECDRENKVVCFFPFLLTIIYLFTSGK